MTTTSASLLEVSDLRVDYYTRQGIITVIHDISFKVDVGETVAIVGESGSGKSVTVNAVLGMLALPGRVVGGQVVWRGAEVTTERYNGSTQGLRRLLGSEIGLVRQDSLASLHPTMSVGKQIAECFYYHGRSGWADADRRVKGLLADVHLPESVANSLPHELSGGMRQRVMIAMAIASGPRLLVLDEPTTALDVTVQAQILRLIAKLINQDEMAVILVTHDLGVVAGLCESILVMYAGRVVESGLVRSVFAHPVHPYSSALLRSTPRLDSVSSAMPTIPGVPPAPKDHPAGCSFAARCPVELDMCAARPPELLEIGSHGSVACWGAHG